MKHFQHENTAAHGGKTICEGDSSLVLEWLSFVHAKNNFDGSRSSCQRMGGDLFSNLTGKSDQIDFFREKTRMEKCFFLGIQRRPFSKEWVSLKGEVMNDRIYWGGGQPNWILWETQIGGWKVLGKFDYLHDITKDDQCQAVCQMPV